MRSDLAAIGAVLLWASLASIGAGLASLPPLLLTGLGLTIGSLLSLPISGFRLSQLKVAPKVLAVGVYGLLGFHLALFAALQTAPAIQANLINYLWPLLLVLLAPLFIKTKLTARQVIGAVVGFVGAALAIASGGDISGGFEIGYLYAFAAAVIWATYSLMTKRLGDFPTSSVGTFALVSGLLAIVGHFLWEPAAIISATDWWLLLLMGLGPLGGAFYLWDYALKNGPAQRVGLISFATPLLSTTLLILTTGAELSPLLLLSAVLIVGAAIIGRGRQ